MTDKISSGEELVEAGARVIAAEHGSNVFDANHVPYEFTDAERDQYRAEARAVLLLASADTQALERLKEGVQRALDWAAREYRQCIIAARCTHDGGHYERANGRAEAYRQLATMAATGAGLPVPDWNGIRDAVPADGIYR